MLKKLNKLIKEFPDFIEIYTFIIFLYILIRFPCLKVCKFLKIGRENSLMFIFNQNVCYSYFQVRLFDKIISKFMSF